LLVKRTTVWLRTTLVLLDLAKNCSFLNWKLTPVPKVLKFTCGCTHVH
jgi:hypothetical protein